MTVLIDTVHSLTRYLLGAPLLSICLLAFAATAAGAQSPSQSASCGKDRKVSAKALDEMTWKQLNGIYEEVSDEKYDSAYDELQKMLGRSGRDAYLKAIINQALAQVEWSREHYDAALTYFEKAVELDALPDQAHFALMYQIAQLYYMKERYGDALDRLELWFCTAPKDKITAAAYVLKASIYAQMKDYRQTLQAIDMAISMEPTPQESWYQLKLASHYELEQYPQAAATLENMIGHWPDKKLYWTQLAQTYFNLKQEDKALAVAALAYRKKLWTSQTDVTYLAYLYANANVPYKAAAVLQKGIEDGIVESSEKFWTAVADYWYVAEEMEKALAALRKGRGCSVRWRSRPSSRLHPGGSGALVSRPGKRWMKRLSKAASTNRRWARRICCGAWRNSTSEITIRPAAIGDGPAAIRGPGMRRNSGSISCGKSANAAPHDFRPACCASGQRSASGRSRAGLDRPFP